MVAETALERADPTGMDAAIAAYLAACEVEGEEPPHGPGLPRDAEPIPDEWRGRRAPRSGRRLPPGRRVPLPEDDHRLGRVAGDPAPALPRDPRVLLLVHPHGLLRAAPLRGDPQRQGGAEGDSAADGGRDPGAAGGLRPDRGVRLPQPGDHLALSRHGHAAGGVAPAHARRCVLGGPPHPHSPRQRAEAAGGAVRGWARGGAAGVPRSVPGSGRRSAVPHDRPTQETARTDEQVPSGDPLHAARQARRGARQPPPLPSHLFATWAIENHARELDVQYLLGHSTSAMVRRYSATYDAAKAADAHAAFSPAARLLAGGNAAG